MASLSLVVGWEEARQAIGLLHWRAAITQQVYYHSRILLKTTAFFRFASIASILGTLHLNVVAIQVYAQDFSGSRRCTSRNTSPAPSARRSWHSKRRRSGHFEPLQHEASSFRGRDSGIRGHGPGVCKGKRLDWGTFYHWCLPGSLTITISPF